MALDLAFTGFLIRIALGAGVVLLVIILAGVTIPARGTVANRRSDR